MLPNRSVLTNFVKPNTDSDYKDLIAICLGYAGFKGFINNISIADAFHINIEKKDVHLCKPTDYDYQTPKGKTKTVTFENIDITPNKETFITLQTLKQARNNTSSYNKKTRDKSQEKIINNKNNNPHDNRKTQDTDTFEIAPKQTTILQESLTKIEELSKEKSVAHNKNIDTHLYEIKSLITNTKEKEIIKNSNDNSDTNKGKKKKQKFYILILLVALSSCLIYLKYDTNKHNQTEVKKPLNHQKTQNSNISNPEKEITDYTKKDSISWAKAKKEYSINSFQTYLSNFPEGIFAKSATKEIELIKSFGIEMVYVNPGSFVMGCNKNQSGYCDENETPSHKVTLTQGDYIAKYEVTQKLWKIVMGNNPSGIKGDSLPVNNFYADQDTPTFIKKLNKLTGKDYRLPTEAEWEFASRGGNHTKGYLYSGSNNLDSVGWYLNNAQKTLHPVGQKKPNELGIYDMSGNVWEFVSDDCDITSGYLGSKEHEINPHEKVSNRYYLVFKGGSFQNSSKYCRVSVRNNGYGNSANSYGLRLAMDLNL
ncbi:formylglycine-generating enzyme family protein [Tenacibaculum sp. TC6]|uniref:formylglycine-generating enzyme family protein n=1 Tax=Tenacibaculum sp. TC6 TaxID=3423223 RepID=UPI003D36E356